MAHLLGTSHVCSTLPRPHARGCLAASAHAPRNRHRIAAASKGCTPQTQQPGAHRALSIALSAVLALGLLGGAPARAESNYEKRQAELERRRQQLASAREKALAKGGIMQQREEQPGTPAAPPPADETPALATEPAKAAAAEPAKATAPEPPAASAPLPASTEPASIKAAKEEREKKPPLTQREEGQSVQDLFKASLGDYETMMKTPSKAGQPAPEATKPAEAPKPAEAAKSPFQQRDTTTAKPAEPSGPKFPNAKTQQVPKATPEPAQTSKASSSAPARPLQATPALPEPPKPAKKLGPQPVAPAPAKAASKTGKVKGPLPMTLAQLIVLGIFGGIGYAFTAKAEASANLVQAAVELMISTYQKLEGAVAQRFAKDKPYVSELRQPSGTDAVDVQP